MAPPSRRKPPPSSQYSRGPPRSSARRRASTPIASAARLLGLCLWTLAQRDLQVEALSVTQDGNRHLIAGVFVVLDPPPQVATAGDRLSVDGHDDVAAGHDDLVADGRALAAGLNARLLRTGGHLLHEQALEVGLDPELLLHLRTDIGERDAGDTNLRMTVATRLNQLGRNALGDVDGNREP